jgi:alpha-glucan,water dikinase
MCSTYVAGVLTISRSECLPFSFYSESGLQHLFLQALLNHIKSGFDMGVYWKTLNDSGVTKERMLSYDRPVRSEPKFKADQKDGLIRDLTHYLRTLKVCFSALPVVSFLIILCQSEKGEFQDLEVLVRESMIFLCRKL